MDAPSASFAQRSFDWLQTNLFSSVGNTLLTLAGLAVLWFTLVPFFDWGVFSAVSPFSPREACAAPGAGACWPFVWQNLGQIIYGSYGVEDLTRRGLPEIVQRWRVDVVFGVGALGLAWLMIPRLPARFWVGVFMLTGFPVLTYGLLTGGYFGLPIVPTDQWGGLLLTLVIAFTGIVVSLPLGILLALGRRSQLPVIKALCVAFIELIRAVPLITILFMASNLLPLFLPQGVTIDKLLAALIMVALFSSAYMAEVVRGGLAAVPSGQAEAAKALGLGYWRMTGLVVLPQALKIALPAIVSNFIGLFKDTSLIAVIGFFDLLGIVQRAFSQPGWASPGAPFTGYLFAAAVFWAFCFGMSRYAAYLERKLGGGKSAAGAT